jgi:hypothetical protein
MSVFAPESGHCLARLTCLLWAKSGPSALQQFCCYSIISSASDGGDAGLPLSVADVRSLQSDLRSPDWYTGNSN